MKNIIIIGSGRHAKVAIDVIRENPQYQIRGCVSPDKIKDLNGIPLLGTDEALASLYSQGISHAFIAVGDNRSRFKLAEKIKAIGFALINAISPHAILSRSVALGSGILVMPGAVINVDAKVRDLAIINTNASVDHDCVIGVASHIAPGSVLAGDVEVGEGALLGVGASAMPKVKIGSWSIVGAGSVVTRDVLPYSTVAGVPAKVIKPRK